MAKELPKESKESEDDEDGESERRVPPLLNFADFECYLDDEKVFHVNLACWSHVQEDEIHHVDNVKAFLEEVEELTVTEDGMELDVITYFHTFRI